MRAVRRAAPSTDVYVLGSSTLVDSPRVARELEQAAARYPGGLLVLTDPDVAGRKARVALDARLPGRCRHAFLPARHAAARNATTYHEAGNVGVEHAAPEAIRAALASARSSDPLRQEFSRMDLMAAGLVAEMGVRGGDVTQRRALVCAYLGQGDCDGKQLLRQLNCYGFGREELAAALAWAEQQLRVQ